MMSNRERFRAIAKFERPGDLFTWDDFWWGTPVVWINQGAPPEVKDPLSRWKFFHHDHPHWITGIVSGLLEELPYVVGEIEARSYAPPIVPVFEQKVLEEDERTATLVIPAGQTVRVSKDDPGKMPMYLDWPVKDRASWDEFKKRLDPHTPERWPSDWDTYVQKINSLDDPVVLQVGGFYGYLREWVGSERILYMFYDDPVLIEDMMEHMLYMETEIIKRALKDIKIDQATFWEDMCYKTGPLISPDMVRKFMVPRYKKITELLHSYGVDIIFLDSDGNVNELIPLWLECGINYIWPMEVVAGNDVVALRKKYGKDLIIGGAIDKRALLKGKEAIREEVMSKVPFLLEKGGYFPSIDHEVPPDVTFENYCYYTNTLREVAGLEKLSF